MRLLTIISFIFIMGCAPIRATYYKPLVEDGYYKSQCGGPSNFGATRLNDKLAYFIYVGTDEGDGISVQLIRIEYRIYPGSILTLSTGTVVVSENNHNTEAPIGPIHKREWKAEKKKVVETQYSFSDQLIGYPETNLPAWTFGLSEIQKWGGFSFEIKIPPYHGDEFSIKLPGMIINGEVLNPNIIKVRKVTEHYWQFIC